MRRQNQSDKHTDLQTRHWDNAEENEERRKRAAFHANRLRVECTAGETGKRRAACHKEAEEEEEEEEVVVGARARTHARTHTHSQGDGEDAYLRSISPCCNLATHAFKIARKNRKIVNRLQWR